MNLFRNIGSNQASKAEPSSSSTSMTINDSNESLIVDFPTTARRFSYSSPSSSTNPTTSSSLSHPSSRKVQFSGTLDTLLLTDEDRLSNLHKQWYDKSDYKGFRKTLKKDVTMARGISTNTSRRSSPDSVSMSDESVAAMMESSGNLNYEEENYREVVNGIEKFVCPRTLRRVEMNRMQHQDAVLDAQDCQASPEQLRRASLEFSEWSLELAMSIARIDD